MRTCHACQAELDIAALMAGRCPKCDTPIPAKASKTVQDTVFLGDVARAETTPDVPPVELGDESLELESAQEDSTRESHSVAGDGTVELPRTASDDETKAAGAPEDETSDDRKSGDEPKRGATPTVPDRQDVTVDLDSAEAGEAAAKSGEGSTGRATQPFVSDVTVDLPAGTDETARDNRATPDSATSDSATSDSATSDSATSDSATSDSATSDSGGDVHATTDSDDAQATTDTGLKKLPTQWRGTYTSDTTPGSTIRQRGTVTGFKSSLPIKSRFVSERRSIEPTMRATFQPGEVPDYELLDVIGEGGMGVVYSAHQSSIARTVAIKMLKPTKKIGEEQRDKFISEAVVTGELDHPNIVPIYDLGANESGALFYSMKRVKGTPWDDVIEEKGLDENLQNLLRVADAVAFAHAHGVVHRDLKPENVMLGDYGEVLVMDWGLARVTDDFANAESIYQADSLGGTPAYMAPEMARGPVGRIDFRSDVYLLGAILYEIVGGKPPHSGRDVMQCLMAAAQNRIDPIEYEGELKVIAMRAMAPQREDRYQTVKLFQDAVRAYQSHSESLVLTTHSKQSLEKARQQSNYELFERSIYGFQEALNLWDGNEGAAVLLAEAQLDYAQLAYNKGDYDLAISRLDRDRPDHAELLVKVEEAKAERDARVRRLKNFRRVVVAMGVVIIGILGVATVWIGYARHQAVLAKDEAIKQQQLAEEARDREEAAKLQEEAAKKDAIEQKEYAEQQELIAVKERKEAVDAREQERQAKEQERRAKEEKERQRLAAVEARENEKIAKEREEYEAYVARIGLADAKIDENAYEYAAELLKDCLPQLQQRDLRHWEWGRLAYLCQLSVSKIPLHNPVDSVAYSPNGEQYAVAERGGNTTVRDALTGEVLHAFDFGQYVGAVAFSPDGKLLAASGGDNAIHVVDLETGNEALPPLTGHEDGIVSVRFSPDGKQLLSCSYDHTARRWDVASGQELQVLRGHSWWVWAAEFSPDQSRIVTAGQDGRVVVWNLADGTGDGTRQQPGMYTRGIVFQGHDGAVFAAAFSPDGRFIATGGYDNRVIVWDPDEVDPISIPNRIKGLPDPKPSYLVLEGHDGPVRSVAFSPTHPTQLASGSHDNTLRLWDMSTGRLVKALRGHSGRVFSCAFSPNGDRLLSGAHDNDVRLWNIEGYQEMRVLRSLVLEGHRDAVLSARFSQDGTQVATASRDRTAALWDTVTGRRLRQFAEGHQFLASNVAFFADGKRLATGAGDNSVRIWDVASGTELMSLTPTGRMGTLAISPDGRWIVTGSPEKDAVVWETQSGQEVARLGGHPAEVTVAAFSGDGNMLVTGDERGNLRQWQRSGDAGDFQFVRQLDGHSRPITAVKFLPDGQRLVTASGDRTCSQWDLNTGQELRPLVLRHPKWVSSLDVSRDGRWAVTACEDNVVRLWSLADARVLAELESTDVPFNWVSMSPDADAALLTSSRAGQVRVWRFTIAADGRVTAERDTEPRLDFENPTIGGQVWSAVFAPEGNRFATIGGNDARLWDAANNEQVVRFSPHGAVADATLSPDGRYLVTGSWDGSAKIWDASTGKAIRRLDGGHVGYVNSAEFSPDGRQVLTASDDGTARLWDFETGQPTDTIFRHDSSRVFQATFSPDGQQVLTTGEDGKARIWDRANGRQLHVLEGHTLGVLCGRFSPNGRVVITGSADNSAKIWNAQTGELRRTIEGHTAGVTSVAFSPDNQRVLTGSQDKTVKLWDPRPVPPKEILTLPGHTREVTSVSFSPDGRLVLTASRDGTAIIWLTVDWRGDAPLTRLFARHAP